MSKDEGPSVMAAVGGANGGASGSAEKAEEPVFNIGDVISGFKLVKKIDEGGFGQVFKVTKDEKTFYAMKLESNSQEGGSAIKLEMHVLGQLPQNSVFPGFLCGGRKARFHYLVLELLGDNLKMLKARSSKEEIFTDGTWSRLGIQCMYALKVMHDRGFVHRDVKPSNFAIGLNTPTENRSRIVLLFDFGLARKFVKTEKVYNESSKKNIKGSQAGKGLAKSKSKLKNSQTEQGKPDNRKLIPPKRASGTRKPVIRTTFRLARPHTEFRGTQQYASPNAHAQLELGRHDDIWSLMYMIAECFLELPWTNNDDLPVEVIKAQSPLLRLFTDEKNLSRFSGEQYQRIKDIDKMLNESNYYTHPNYELVYDFLKETMTKSKVTWDSPYDWEVATSKSSSELSKTVKGKAVEEKKPYKWIEPGNLFKEDKWASLDKPISKSAEVSKPPAPKAKTAPKPAPGKKVPGRNRKDDTRCQQMSREDSVNQDSMKKEPSMMKAVDSKKDVKN